MSNNKIIPETAGTGVPTVETEDVTDGLIGADSGTYKSLNAEIQNINGFDILNFSLEPDTSIVTNQETMSYMDGGLVTSATLGAGGIWSWFARDVTGSSVLQNLVTNPTPTVRKLTLSPLLHGSIVQINVKKGERWRFADHSFLACTPNLVVSGNLNVFSNFRLMFVGQGVTYTTVEATDSDGIVWISAYGAAVKHVMTLGTADSVPLFINNGCFLGMLDYKDGIDYWGSYVDVGTANGLLSALFTQLGWVMKIQDSEPRKHDGRIECTVITQSLNPQNFERYVSNIAAKSATNSSFLTAGYGSDYKYSVSPIVPMTGAVVATAVVAGPYGSTAANGSTFSNGSTASNGTTASNGSTATNGSTAAAVAAGPNGYTEAAAPDIGKQGNDGIPSQNYGGLTQISEQNGGNRKTVKRRLIKKRRSIKQR